MDAIDRHMAGVDEILWDWDDRFEIIILSEIDTTRHREWFEEYLEERSKHFDEVEYYLEEGSWRDTGELTDDEEQTVEDHVFNQIPNQCYYNAQTSMGPALEYVEGYAVGRTAFPHAWLEVNGKVAEITPTVNRKSTDYYGVQFDMKTVAVAMQAAEKADPIVESVLR